MESLKVSKRVFFYTDWTVNYGHEIHLIGNLKELGE